MREVLTVATVLAATLSADPSASAEPLPSINDLKIQIGTKPFVVEVIEPHLSDAENHTRIEYVGYPAEDVLSVALGADWREQCGALEFRALDG